MGRKSKKGGTCVYEWLIHFAVQQLLDNTVRQIYPNKHHLFLCPLEL